ncbi:GNAT family N-acetyltransferase [Yoonia sp.]|uniref:GNAT family N-acetyltransferase n=1 Tax=Yoonia sp. TaxID=2212373 RepID=UPI0023B75AB7
MRNFTFRRLTRSDLPLMERWLDSAHVRGWWPDAERQVNMMLEDIDNPAINMLVVCLIDHPFGYMHDYDAHAYRQPQFADLPTGTRVLSTFVGDPGFTGQGHAPAYIEARTRDLRLRHPLVAVGPDAKDSFAISTYGKAGFRRRRLCPSRSGRLVHVMTKL